MDDFYAYVILSACGQGNDPGRGHGVVLACLPDNIREHFSEAATDDGETSWSAELDQPSWEAFRDHFDIIPDECDHTMGMLTEYGHMWALSIIADGMDWNAGGITPLDYVQVYFCAQDADMMAHAGVEA